MGATPSTIGSYGVIPARMSGSGPPGSVPGPGFAGGGPGGGGGGNGAVGPYATAGIPMSIAPPNAGGGGGGAGGGVPGAAAGGAGTTVGSMRGAGDDDTGDIMERLSGTLRLVSPMPTFSLRLLCARLTFFAAHFGSLLEWQQTISNCEKKTKHTSGSVPTVQSPLPVIVSVSERARKLDGPRACAGRAVARRRCRGRRRRRGTGHERRATATRRRRRCRAATAAANTAKANW